MYGNFRNYIGRHSQHMSEPSHSSLLYLLNTVFAFAFLSRSLLLILLGQNILLILRKQLLWKTSTLFCSLLYLRDGHNTKYCPIDEHQSSKLNILCLIDVRQLGSI